ncbi:MAG: DUF11 domain-containing protein [Deltaproteobacteria bacterium]|nr:MAG: DUF11 domain-containing protein [Deltaproteobacteria bacterium]
MTVKQLISGAVAILLLATGPAFAAGGDIRFASIAEVEVQQVNTRGEKTLVRQPAVLLKPGEIVIYTNSFTNTGQQPAEKLVISSPVAANTEYLGGSATETGFDLAFSVDKGKSYGKPGELTVPDGKGGKRPATTKDYTDIRWTMQAPLKPGATGIVEFRARVK